jgi:hypothetical protein
MNKDEKIERYTELGLKHHKLYTKYLNKLALIDENAADLLLEYVNNEGCF